MDPAAGKVKLVDWSKRWLASIDVKPKTRAGYESMLNARILPSFGNLQLLQIPPAAIRTWLTEMMAEGLSPATAAGARRILHACLQTAVDDGILARNPVDRRVKAPTVRPRRQRFLTADQVDALAAAADARQPGMGPLIVLMAWSGLRWGEAVALRGASIDIARRRVHVREAATEVHGKLLFGTPKSHEARSVIVPRFVLEPLLPRLDAIGPADLVFTSPKGAALRNGNFRKSVWRTAVRYSGAPGDLMPHDLRDTAASLMISAGASIVAVARALGHSDPALTLRVYAGLYEDDLEDLADKIEARYGDSRPSAQERAEAQSASDDAWPEVAPDSASARRAHRADLGDDERTQESL